MSERSIRQFPENIRSVSVSFVDSRPMRSALALITAAGLYLGLGTPVAAACELDQAGLRLSRILPVGNVISCATENGVTIVNTSGGKVEKTTDSGELYTVFLDKSNPTILGVADKPTPGAAGPNTEFTFQIVNGKLQKLPYMILGMNETNPQLASWARVLEVDPAAVGTALAEEEIDPLTRNKQQLVRGTQGNTKLVYEISKDSDNSSAGFVGETDGNQHEGVFPENPERRFFWEGSEWDPARTDPLVVNIPLSKPSLEAK